MFKVPKQLSISEQTLRNWVKAKKVRTIKGALAKAVKPFPVFHRSGKSHGNVLFAHVKSGEGMSTTLENGTSIAAQHWDDRYDQQIKSAWFSNDLVLAELNTRITGRNAFWLAWLMTEYLQSRPKRVLSIGCGDGAHELVIARQRWADHIDAFDGSASGIRIARETSERENLPVTFYVDTFEQFVASPVTTLYDAVFFIGALHHVKDLEGMLDRVRRCLNPDGVMIINEYCGPCYNIYEPERIQIMNGILRALAPEFKLSPDTQWTNMTIDAVFAADPTEAVRAALIPAFVRHYFSVVLERPFGGTLLHPLFDHLNSRKLNDGSPESVSIVRMLIEMENTLIASGVLKNDFLLGIYGQKR
jgi:SAM-dependent methyltransferase